jgi:hypothetical protein
MFRRDFKFIGMPEKNEVPPRISVRFTCPDCGGHRLNIESNDVLGCQGVKGIDEAGNLVLEHPTFHTVESDFYLSCPDCGYDRELDVEDGEEEQQIIEWLKANFEPQYRPQ